MLGTQPQRGDQPWGNHGHNPSATTPGRAQKHTKVLSNASVNSGQSKEWTKSDRNWPNSPAYNLEHFKDEPAPRKGWILQQHEGTNSPTVAERSLLKHFGWTLTRPTKKVKMREHESISAQTVVGMGIGDSGTYGRTTYSNGARTVSGHDTNKRGTCVNSRASRTVKVTLTIQQQLGVENIQRMFEGVGRFLDGYQREDGEAELLPYNRDQEDTTPAIKSPPDLKWHSLRNNYFQARRYINCTITWLLTKPPMSKELIRERAKNGGKGPTPIYVRLWI